VDIADTIDAKIAALKNTSARWIQHDALEDTPVTSTVATNDNPER